MRKFLTVILMVIWGWQALAASSVCRPPRHVDTGNLIQDDRFIPFPWSIQKPMRANILEGTWYAKNGAFTSYFSFLPSRGLLEEEYLVRQIDVLNCQVVASGWGIQSKSGKTLMSDLTYWGMSRWYRMVVRSYNDRGPIKDMDIVPVEGQVYVMSVQPSPRDSYVHMTLKKVSTDAGPGGCRFKTFEEIKE